MKKLFPLLCLLSIVQMVRMSPSLSAEEEVLDSDLAVLKVQNQIYFLSDLQQMVSDVEVLHCLLENSTLLRATGLNREKWDKWPSLDKSNLSQHASFLGALINLIKVRHYLVGQEILVKEETWVALLRKGREQSCFKAGDFNWTPEWRPYIKGEFLFKERFQDSSFWVSDSELSQILEKDRSVDPAMAKSVLKEKKIQEAIILFMNSLLRQMPHEILVKWNK